MKSSKAFVFLQLLIAVSLSLFSLATHAASSGSQTLLNKYSELKNELNNSEFKRELYMTSQESSNNLKGEIYAVVDYPYATVNKALNNSSHWCDVLILHINIKYCFAQKNN